MNRLKTMLPYRWYSLFIGVGIVLLVVITLLLLTSSMASADPSLSSENTIKIGAVVPITGPAEFIGHPQLNSIQLAVMEINAAGGIDIEGVKYTLELLVEDDQCDPVQSPTAAQNLVDKSVVAVVGHSCSGATAAAQEIYYNNGIPIISPSATNPSLTGQFNTTFRVVPRDDSLVKLLATYFREYLHLEHSAVVERNGFFASWATEEYSKAFTTLGGQITSYHSFDSTAEFTAILTDIKTHKPDVIYFGDDSPVNAGEFSRSAHSLGMTEIVIGWSTWDNNRQLLADYAAEAGAAAVGDVVVMAYRDFADMPGWQEFLAAYKAAEFATYGEDPGLFGVFAYDALSIIADAISRVQSTDPEDLRDAIAQTQDFLGVIGSYEGFDEIGDVIPQWAWLETYGTDGWQKLNPSRLFLPLLVLQ
jgi:branched-chain amino acid transport system substrate-binding protein